MDGCNMYFETMRGNCCMFTRKARLSPCSPPVGCLAVSSSNPSLLTLTRVHMLLDVAVAFCEVEALGGVYIHHPIYR